MLFILLKPLSETRATAFFFLLLFSCCFYLGKLHDHVQADYNTDELFLNAGIKDGEWHSAEHSSC